MTSSLTTNSNTNQYTHRLFFSLTGCLLHHKKSFISPSSTYLLFLVPQVAFTIKKKTFYFPSFPHPPSPTFFCLQHYQKHYQHIYSLSTCLFSLLNSNTNPGQDWSHDFHFTFLCYSCVTLLSHPCHSHVQLCQKITHQFNDVHLQNLYHQ